LIDLPAAMERLLKAKRIAVETIGPPSKQRKRLIAAPANEADERISNPLPTLFRPSSNGVWFSNPL